uniref:Semaphorin-2A n=1 Tax=Strigamia maritima TaxID=126957 RepID=T1IJU2_STRMM
MTFFGPLWMTHQVVFILLFLSGIFLSSAREDSEQSYDFRHISYKELSPTIQRFTKSGVTSYSQLLFDPTRYQLVVGARDYLFRLSIDGLQILEESYWPPPSTTIQLCQQKGQSVNDCRNYIKILLQRNGKVLACGTNAFAPNCSWRHIDDLSMVSDEMSGIGMCPYSPHQNVTAMISSSGDYFVGTAVDFSARDSAIYKFSGKTIGLRTVQYNHKWLSEPNFIASYDINNFTYFFFRETAVEYINCGKAIYSRVARICQNDAGGQHLLKDNWTTFLKARLNCSLPGEYPFYYNELQSVFYVEQENIIYATFTTPANSILGTAVCAFNLSAIERTFRASFKYQSNPGAAWEKHVGSSDAKRHFQCETPGSTWHVDSERYQLMDEAVPSTLDKPLITAELERFSHIVVDVVPTKHHEAVHVIFIATMEGTIKKYTVLPRTHETCLLEVLKLHSSNHTEPIHILRILKDTNSLYIGTGSSVMKISVERCSRFASKRTCLNSMDPYCGWNSHLQVCATAPQKNPLSVFWQQVYPSCPILTEPVDGGWGKWSEWFECSHIGDASSGGRCTCQTRKCTSPPPAHGGQPCEGANLRVANCSRNGQWTEWSAWSACSQTCGLAVKMRRRACGNPKPAHGGRTCVGSDRDEIYCTSNPPCPVSTVGAVNGRWSDWSPWDECSVPCGGGFHMRRRRCNNPAPQNGGRECLGCPVEYRSCNTQTCNEARKSTVWTPWLKGNISREGYYELRFRFSCKANVPDSKFIRIGHMKKEERFCLEDGQNCVGGEFLSNDGEWSSWSTWTKCSAPCGGGFQSRDRSCNNPHPTGNGLDCVGDKRMNRACNTHFCNNLDDSEKWSSWSLCESDGFQHRERSCPITNIGSNKCQEATKETRPCDDMDNELLVSASIIGQLSGIRTEHLVAGCIVCFLLGSLISGVGCYYYMVRLNRNRRMIGNRLFSNTTAPPNVYVPPKDCLNKNYNTNSLSRSKRIPLMRENSIKNNGHKMNTNLNDDGFN